MVLVTGGSGLLGGYLLRELLRQGEKVKALYRSRYPSLLTEEEIRSIEWVKGDIFDVVLLSELCGQCNEVYHCAGLVSFNPSRKDDLLKVNVQGTANVVNACVAGNVRKLVHVSSVSALGRKRDGITVTEEAKWSEENNLSSYGKSKYLAEVEIWRGISEGLNAVMVNPTIILGVGDWNDSSAATFKNAYKEFPWYTEGISGFVYAGDVAMAMVSLMKADISEERFIVSAENLPYREVFNMMAKNFSKKPPHRHASKFLAGIVWRLERLKSLFTGSDPLLTKETAETARMKVYFDGSKLSKFLPGFSYKPIDEAIAESCREYLLRVNR
ncbi:MAG TPA: NAD-dependent epimerase/dehydratase family protein [Chitinophagaceae bacterium]|nr:NAD-dependent epimerase/dehydratase family protein [Chitinophagaceae bacterium]